MKEVIKYKQGNKESVLKIIDIFSPIIDKYSRLLDREDTRQDLLVHLMKVMEKIDLHNENFCKDKIIVSYIAKSIRNEYIRLSRNKY